MKVAPSVARAALASATRVTGVNLPLPPDISEREFQARIIEEAGANGWLYFHVYDSRQCVAGFPDLVLLRAGVLVFAELKVKRNKPTAAQREWLDALAAVPGITVRHWRPEHWPDILTLLRSQQGAAP